jgi:hypothetical protein
MIKLAVILLAIMASALAQKKQPKPPEVELLEVTAHRDEGRINLDGRVKNVGEKPIRGLTVVYDFLDSDKHVISSGKGGIEEASLVPGDEAEFHAQLQAPPRATSFQVNFEDGGGKDLRLAKSEILPIE